MLESRSHIGDIHKVIQRQANSTSISLPERELLGFIDSVSELIGTETTSHLTELWLDELSSMESIPERLSPEWRVVTLRASARLASRLLGMCHKKVIL